MKVLGALVLMASACSAAGAPASVYAFSYQASGGILSGQLLGTLQADHNTVRVDQVLDFVRYNGIPGIALPYLTTGSSFYGTERAPAVTFDGSNLDFFACPDAECLDGIVFDPDTIEFVPVLSTGGSFGEFRELTDPSRWTLSEVPEPATWALLLGGFAMVGVAARRRTHTLTA